MGSSDVFNVDQKATDFKGNASDVVDATCSLYVFLK